MWKVNEDDEEIGAYMFRRTLPCMHLAPADVRWMVGGWRDRIIIYSGGIYGPFPGLIKAFLDCGAKAVICPEYEGGQEHDKGGSEDEDAASSSSDWETTPAGKKDEDEQQVLSEFICEIYESIHVGGDGVDVALHKALASHPSITYSCHLPHPPMLQLTSP